MAIAINFDKARMEQLLDCLNKGRPIAGVESVDDFLALAGACFFMAMSQGPELQKGVDWSLLTQEPPPDEEGGDTFVPEIHAAIEYYAQLALLLADGGYDQSFEPKHKAIVLIDDGDKTVIPVEGMRADTEREAEEE
ncbi:MAG: hypothetical protein K2R98_07050 [Gemmataceae bacterium]|nr:hypothetical protein [Gemmataceae bacterium]